MNSIKDVLKDAFFNSGSNYAILQLEDKDEYAYEMFASINELKRMGKNPVSDHYELIYSGELDYIPGNMKVLLEYLYQRFNIDVPEDFNGHSLSVSDVIAVKDNKDIRFWFVDAIGFTELEDFA